MFQDEARFGLISDPSRCWAPPGVRPIVSTQIVRQYTYAYAAVSPHDGVLDSLVLPWVNAETMSYYLAEVGRRHAHEFILMVLDGAGWHVANDLVVPPNMRLVPLPPRSPELMPAEHVWDDVREKRFANRVFDSLEAVDAELADELRLLEADRGRVRSLAGFDWVLSLKLD